MLKDHTEKLSILWILAQDRLDTYKRNVGKERLLESF